MWAHGGVSECVRLWAAQVCSLASDLVMVSCMPFVWTLLLWRQLRGVSCKALSGPLDKSFSIWWAPHSKMGTMAQCVWVEAWIMVAFTIHLEQIKRWTVLYFCAYLNFSANAVFYWINRAPISNQKAFGKVIRPEESAWTETFLKCLCYDLYTVIEWLLPPVISIWDSVWSWYLTTISSSSEVGSNRSQNRMGFPRLWYNII